MATVEELIESGDWFLQRGNVAAAISFYQQALELNINPQDAYARLALVYGKLNRPDEAIQYMVRALEIDPDNAEYLLNLGTFQMARGKVDKAILCYERALKIDPNFAAAHSSLLLAKLY